MSKTLSFIVKTVSGCNMACKYCYSPHRQDYPLIVIQEDIIKKLIQGSVEFGVVNVQFVWHGGEPLLAGSEFFKRAIILQKKFGASWQNYDNVFQSNGLLIDNEWIDLIQKHDFGIGISIDGDAETHDMNRLHVNGGRTHQKVLKKFNKLRGYFGCGGVCAVVSKDSIGKAKKIVDFFVTNSIPELDLLPCVATETNQFSYLKAVTPDEYADFMISAFDRWLEHDEPEVNIRFFSNIIALLFGGSSDFCQFTPAKCRNYLAIDYNGDVYPCDSFIGIDRWKLGSLVDDDLTTILTGERQRSYLRQMEDLDPLCQNCIWLNICWGGCTFHRYLVNPDLKSQSFFCRSRKRIFAHIAKTLEVIPQREINRYMPKPISRKTDYDLYLDLGTKCNNSCYFCAAASQSGESSIHPIYKKAILEGRQNESTCLILTGGEPTIYKKIIGLIKDAKDIGFEEIQLQTNGRLLNDFYFAKLLVDSGVTDFGISLHGHTSEIHEACTRIPGSFKETLRGIENIGLIFGPNPPIAVNCVINPLNLNYLKELTKLLISYDVSTIKLSYIHAIGRAQSLMKRGLWPSISETLPHIINAIDIAERLGRATTSLLIEAVPYCVLKGYEHYCSEYLIKPIFIITSDGSLEKFDIGTERIKREECKVCTYNEYCCGPWKQYPLEFGWDEFIPISNQIQRWSGKTGQCYK